MKPQLTATELQQLRNELIEHRELHAERKYFAQIRRYLRQQQLVVEFSPSVIGIRIRMLAPLAQAQPDSLALCLN